MAATALHVTEPLTRPAHPPRPASAPPAAADPAVAILCYLTVSVVWGTTYLAIRWGIETIPPFTMAAVRFLVAGTILWAAVRPRSARPSRRDWQLAAAAGVLLLVGGNGLVVWAEQHVASGLAAVLVATMPLWTVLLDVALFAGARPGPRLWLGLALGLAGVAILSLGGGEGGGSVHAGGAAALLVACASWALGSLLTRRAAPGGSPFLVAAMQMLAGGVALSLVALATGELSRFDPNEVSGRSLLGLGWLIAAGSIAAMSAYAYLVRAWPPARVATYSYVNPAVALAAGSLLAGEPFTRAAAAGTAVILAGVLVVNTRRG